MDDLWSDPFFGVSRAVVVVVVDQKCWQLNFFVGTGEATVTYRMEAAVAAAASDGGRWRHRRTSIRTHPHATRARQRGCAELWEIGPDLLFYQVIASFIDRLVTFKNIQWHIVSGGKTLPNFIRFYFIHLFLGCFRQDSFQFLLHHCNLLFAGLSFNSFTNLNKGICETALITPT